MRLAIRTFGNMLEPLVLNRSNEKRQNHFDETENLDYKPNSDLAKRFERLESLVRAQRYLRFKDDDVIKLLSKLKKPMLLVAFQATTFENPLNALTIFTIPSEKSIGFLMEIFWLKSVKKAFFVEEYLNKMPC